METVRDFIFLDSKITVDGDCSDEIKRHLLLGRKVMTNLDSILKSRDNTLPTKVRLVKDMVFPVVMYRCEIWTIKKAEHRRIDAFELWCWKRLLRVPWTTRRSNQSVVKEISPEYSLEGLMLKLKLQYFGYLMWRADSLETTLMLERLKVGGEWLHGIWRVTLNVMLLKGSQDTEDEMVGWDHRLVWASSRSCCWTGKPGVLQPTESQRVEHDGATELNWGPTSRFSAGDQANRQVISRDSDFESQ